MASTPKTPPKPAPAQVATTVDDQAQRRAELERKKRSGFYTGFMKRGAKSESASQVTGGENQTLG